MKVRFLGVAIILFCHFSSKAQQLSNQQLNRLSDACKLWGHIKYFHPYLQYKNIPYDSAFAEAVPDILAATTKQQYENALSKWLAVLNDPITEVVHQQQSNVKPSTENPSPRVELKDSVLIISIHNLKDLEDYEAVEARLKKQLLKDAKYVLFDLRVERNSVEYEGALDDFFYNHGITRLLGGGLTSPSVRTVAYDGYPEGYFRVNNRKSINNPTELKLPIAFLINEHVLLPEIAFPLQEAGKAVIITEGNLNTNFGRYITHYVSDSIKIKFRTGELVSENGLVNPHADLKLNKEEDPSTNLQKAISFLTAKKTLTQSKGSESSNSGISKDDAYSSDLYPSLGYRVLAAAKIYTVINYFFPNKKLMDRDWDSVFTEYLPHFVAAKDSMEYNMAVAEMYAHIQDSHGFIRRRVFWERKFTGTAWASFIGKVIQNKLVVTALLNDSAAKAEGVSVGDVILKINGEGAMQRLEKMRKYVPASNMGAQNRDLSMSLFRVGRNGEVSKVTIQDKSGKIREVNVTPKIEFTRLVAEKGRPLNNGPIFKLLPDNIGYVDMQRLESKMVDSMFDLFKNTKGFIMDMRGYPKGTAWDIAPRLSEKNFVEAALFTQLMPSHPLVISEREMNKQAVTYTFMQKIPRTNKWRYKGKTIMLINEETKSQAEHSGLFLKAANGTLFVGSQTAGANGGTTNFNIPGQINLTFSGQNISYPNGKTMQRVGLKPDIEVHPTIKGIRDGRDEVLEKAIEVMKKIK